MTDQAKLGRHPFYSKAFTNLAGRKQPPTQQQSGLLDSPRKNMVPNNIRRRNKNPEFAGSSGSSSPECLSGTLLKAVWFLPDHCTIARGQIFQMGPRSYFPLLAVFIFPSNSHRIDGSSAAAIHLVNFQMLLLYDFQFRQAPEFLGDHFLEAIPVWSPSFTSTDTRSGGWDFESPSFGTLVDSTFLGCRKMYQKIRYT